MSGTGPVPPPPPPAALRQAWQDQTTPSRLLYPPASHLTRQPPSEIPPPRHLHGAEINTRSLPIPPPPPSALFPSTHIDSVLPPPPPSSFPPPPPPSALINTSSDNSGHQSSSSDSNCNHPNLQASKNTSRFLEAESKSKNPSLTPSTSKPLPGPHSSSQPRQPRDVFGDSLLVYLRALVKNEVIIELHDDTQIKGELEFVANDMSCTLKKAKKSRIKMAGYPEAMVEEYEKAIVPGRRIRIVQVPNADPAKVLDRYQKTVEALQRKTQRGIRKERIVPVAARISLGSTVPRSERNLSSNSDVDDDDNNGDNDGDGDDYDHARGGDTLVKSGGWRAKDDDTKRNEFDLSIRYGKSVGNKDEDVYSSKLDHFEGSSDIVPASTPLDREKELLEMRLRMLQHKQQPQTTSQRGQGDGVNESESVYIGTKRGREQNESDDGNQRKKTKPS